MSLITALIISLSIILGSPVQAPDAAPTAPTQAVCEEDQPCWDAATMGNGQAGTLKADAWEAIETAHITAPSDSVNLMLSYTETVTGQPVNLPVGYFAIESNTLPNAFHVFKWDTLVDV
jgi:heme A synthase